MRKKMVGAAGFEPTTTCAQGRCATRLRYAPKTKDQNDLREASYSSMREEISPDTSLRAAFTPAFTA